jgi:membrane protease subunit HflK
MNKVILDGVSGDAAGGQGVVPYLPLNNLTPTPRTDTGGSN